MSRTEIKNAKITRTQLGIEDHGILTCYLMLDYGGSGQGFGGYALDGYHEVLGHRVGTAWGMEFVRRVLETLQVNDWEKLPGLNCRVETDGMGGKCVRIGHIIEDRWFNPSDLESTLKEKS